MASPVISGTTTARFDGVRTAFADNWRMPPGDHIASVCVYHQGRLVVDLEGHPVGTRPAPRELTPVYSVTKGIVTLAIGRLVSRGELALDRPLARDWSAFASPDKAPITLRTVLGHRAGLPVVSRAGGIAPLLDADAAIGAIAAETPLWEPGTAFGYHAHTFGWLLDGLVRHATGRTLLSIVHEEVIDPLGLEIRFGGSPSPGRARELVDLVAPALAAPEDRASDLRARALTLDGLLPTPDSATWNSDDVRRASLFGAGARASARSLARLYSASVEPGALLPAATVDLLAAEASAGEDLVLGSGSRFGLGFMLPTTGCPMLGRNSFGHEGVGGSLAFGDTGAALGFGYVTSGLVSGHPQDPRTARLLDAIRNAIA